MNTQLLRYVLEIERTGSISRAAENLYMSQPNLSKAIRELEHTLDITIFHRTTGGVYLTQKGRALADMARSVLAQVSAMEKLHLPEESGMHTLHICAPRTVSLFRAFDITASRMQKKGLILDFEFEEADSSQTIRGLVEDRCQLGVMRFPATQSEHVKAMLHEQGLVGFVLGELPLRVVFSENSPLTLCKSVRQEQLSTCVEVLAQDHQEDWNLYINASRMSPVESAGEIRQNELGARLALLRRVENAYMYSVMLPEDFLREVKLTQRPLDNMNCIVRHYVLYRAGRHLSEAEEMFVETLRQEMEAISGQITE